jgi:hypothetical protein
VLVVLVAVKVVLVVLALTLFFQPLLLQEVVVVLVLVTALAAVLVVVLVLDRVIMAQVEQELLVKDMQVVALPTLTEVVQAAAALLLWVVMAIQVQQVMAVMV